MVASRLRQLASDHNVHVCVIIHPKKVEDDNNLTVGSIFGTAKISQEADSIMILQKNNMQNYRILQVKKNRFDGEVGEVSMLFNPENKRYFEITTEEKQKMLLSHGNYKAIIKDRIAKYGTVEPEEKVVYNEIDLRLVREGGGKV
jgi:twinkle protein